MRSWSPPTDEEVDRAAAYAALPENRAYFFDRLENPRWVPALADKGFFSEPPQPVAAEQPGHVRFPPWPEGSYLARMAAEAPRDVSDILETLPRSDNPTVTRHLLDAAAALSDEELLRLASTINDWLRGPYPESFAEEGAAVAVRLLEAKDIAHGLAVLETLLEVQPDPRQTENMTVDSPLGPFPPEPVGRISDWLYARIIEETHEAVADQAGHVGLKVFCKLLDDALRLSSRTEGSDATDASHIWRPAIEEHEQNIDDDVRNVLVSAVRDLARSLAAHGESELEDVVQNLESRSVVYRRVALHVLEESDFGRDIVTQRVGDPGLRDDQRVRHELAGLLRRRFSDADDQVRRAFLEWVEAGPDRQRYRELHERMRGGAPTEHQVELYADSWRRDWYSFVSDYLEETDAARYLQLVDTVGPPEHPDLPAWSSGGVSSGYESPVPVEEIRAWSPPQVIAFLRSWGPEKPGGWPFGPSVQGLAGTFARVVKERPHDYAAAADQLIGLMPDYLRAYFKALEDGLSEGRAFPWEGPLELAAHASSQPFDPDTGVDDSAQDRGWRWCRGAIASLLRTGLTTDEGRLPFERRTDVWAIVERLTHDPDPSPSDEERYGGENMDPLTLSINTNRGTAMHAVFEYALWCRRAFEAASEDVTPGLDLMPEVADVLQRHLDPSIEPSFAVRAVYGRWLPWLLLIDRDWTTERLDLIFPYPQHSELADVAWGTYVVWCPAYDSSYHALEAQYEEALERVPTELKAGTLGRRSVDAKLGEHLVVLYWRGVADLSVVERFFTRAGDELSGEVLSFVGRGLANTEGDVDPSILERIRRLWEQRLDIAQEAPTEHRLEAQAFGVTFAAGKLADDWALPTLERTVQLAGAPRSGRLVAKRLAVIANEQPVAATRTFVRMLKAAGDGWSHVAWRREAETIVTAAKEATAMDADEHWAEIVDHYVRRGHLEFRDLAP